jgi:DNA-binding response OmpR family regulator
MNMPNTDPAKCTILLLDSDPLTRAILHDVLQRAGYLVMEAGDLGVAVDRLNMSRPNLLVVRPYISSMSGAKAAKYLRTKCPGLPVLMVDGFMADDRLRVQSEVHDMHLFPKPFAPRDLVDKVGELFRAMQAKAR